MKFDEKKRKISEFQDELNKLVRKREELEAHCGQLQCEDDECDNCEINTKLKNLESAINNIKMKISEIEIDIDTWAYTIMGNREAEMLWDRYMSLIQSQISKEEYEELYPEHFLGDFTFPDAFARELIDRCYNDLINLAYKQKSRLAYQVLGVFLMQFGGRMTQDVKELILKNSEWGDERDQLINEQDVNERKEYLFDFREKVKNYEEGIKVIIPWGSFSSNERKSIDYLLKC